MKQIALLSLLLLTTGCAGLGFKPTGLLSAPINPQMITRSHESMNADHQLRITGHGQEHTLILHTELNENSMVMVALGPLGEGVFDCKIDDAQSSCNALSDHIPADMIFEDLQLIFASPEGVGQYLDAGYSVHENGNVRSLYAGETLVSEIQYDSADTWASGITMNNMRLGYTLVLRPLHIGGSE